MPHSHRLADGCLLRDLWLAFLAARAASPSAAALIWVGDLVPVSHGPCDAALGPFACLAGRLLWLRCAKLGDPARDPEHAVPRVRWLRVHKVSLHAD